MHIKKLEIAGFKSFVDRTVIHFDHDVIGVVGPNGCGKSNIVDAIRWCLGEQSAKHLRGRAMEDVIFNGSESRGPAGLSEVTITFDNTNPDYPIGSDASRSSSPACSSRPWRSRRWAYGAASARGWWRRSPSGSGPRWSTRRSWRSSPTSRIRADVGR